MTLPLDSKNVQIGYFLRHRHNIGSLVPSVADFFLNSVPLPVLL